TTPWSKCREKSTFSARAASSRSCGGASPIRCARRSSSITSSGSCGTTELRLSAHFQAKWKPVRRKKMRQHKENLSEARFNQNGIRFSAAHSWKQRRGQASSHPEAPGEKFAALPQPFLINAVPHPVG